MQSIRKSKLVPSRKESRPLVNPALWCLSVRDWRSQINLSQWSMQNCLSPRIRHFIQSPFYLGVIGSETCFYGMKFGLRTGPQRGRALCQGFLTREGCLLGGWRWGVFCSKDPWWESEVPGLVWSGGELGPVHCPVSCPWSGPITLLLQMVMLWLLGVCTLILLTLKPWTPSLFKGWSLDLSGY